MKTVRLLVASALFAVAASSEAAIIAYDGFSYAGELNAKNGGSGWGGAWTAATTVTQIVDPAVNLIDNSALQFTDNNNNSAYRSLASSFSGNQLFVDFYLQIDSGSLTSNDFLALWFGSNAGPNIGIKADEGNTSTPLTTPNDIFGRLSGSDSTFVPNSNIGSTNDVTHHIVGLLSKTISGGNYNRLDVWLNPVFGDLITPDITANGNSGIANFNKIGFRSANLDTGDVVLLDNLRLSTTWNEAMNIPEPATLALLGIGFAGIGGYRSRKS